MITLKMKFPFVLILLVDVPYVKGQQRIEELQHILLRLSFPPFYNSFNKSCCKLYPGGCYKLMDSAGFTCDFLRGRVTKTEKDGWIEFQITNVQFVDGGYYRCGVLGAQTPIYSDYYVEVFASDHHRQSDPSRTTTIKAPNNSTRLLDPTGPALSQDRSDDNRVSRSFGLLLAVIVSITVMIFVSAMIAVACCRVKATCKQSDIYGETLSESLTQEDPEMNAVVYTTVDFRGHQEPEEMYANLRMQNMQASVPDVDHSGMVEYSTLAIQL